MTKAFSYFLIPYSLILVIGTIGYFTHDHGDFVIFLNDFHTPILDFFFKFSTLLGDGIALAVAAIFLLIFKRRYGFILILIGISQAIISWVLKHLIFGKVPRPKKYFDDLSQFNLVEGVELHGYYSFPSGHTMTAFSIATFLSLMFKKPVLSVAMFLQAVVAGISRVYLLQHFLIDILTGSLIGTTLSLIAYKQFEKFLEKV